MSKELYLLRHAKSSWDDPTIGDRDRGLNKRGRRNAPRMGRALAERLEPMVIHVSPALRAQLTLVGLQVGWAAPRTSRPLPEAALYTFSASDLVDSIRGRDDRERGLFLIGHNPGFTDLINWLCGEVAVANLPTAGFARLGLAIDRWSELDAGRGRLDMRLFPRQLDGA